MIDPMKKESALDLSRQNQTPTKRGCQRGDGTDGLDIGGRAEQSPR